MHPASKTFRRVEDLSTEELCAIVAAAPRSWLDRTPRQKSAQRELANRGDLSRKL